MVGRLTYSKKIRTLIMLFQTGEDSSMQSRVGLAPHNVMERWLTGLMSTFYQQHERATFLASLECELGPWLPLVVNYC